MTENRIKEICADVQYITLGDKEWYRVLAYGIDIFVTLYEGDEGEEEYTLSFEELSDRDDVKFYMLTEIEE